MAVLRAHGEFGDQGHARAAVHQTLQGLDAARAVLDVLVPSRTGLLTDAQGLFAQAMSFAQHPHRHAAYLFARDAPLLQQRMPGRQVGQEGFVEQGDRLHVGFVHRTSQYADVQLTCAQPLDDAAGAAFVDGEVGLRMLIGEAAQEQRQEIGGQRGDDADAVGACRTGMDLFDQGFQLVRLAQHHTRLIQQGGTFGCRPYGQGASVEDGQPEFILQLPHHGGESGLGHMADLRRAAELARVLHGHDVVELL